MTSLVSIDEFKAAMSRYTRQVVLTMLGGGLVMLLYSGIIGAYFNEIRARYSSRFEEPTTELLIGLTMFPGLLAFFVALLIGPRRGIAA